MKKINCAFAIVMLFCLQYSCSTKQKDVENVGDMQNYERWYDWNIKSKDTIEFEGRFITMDTYSILECNREYLTVLQPIDERVYYLGDSIISCCCWPYDEDGYYYTRIAVNIDSAFTLISWPGCIEDSLALIMDVVDQSSQMKFPKMEEGRINDETNCWKITFEKHYSGGVFSLVSIPDENIYVSFDLYQIYAFAQKLNNKNVEPLEKISEYLYKELPPFVFLGPNAYLDLFKTGDCKGNDFYALSFERSKKMRPLDNVD